MEREGKGVADSPGIIDAVIMGATLDSLGVAVILTSPDLEQPGPKIEYVNPTLEQLTGYSAAELVGKTPRILQGIDTNRLQLSQLRRDLAGQSRFYGETINYKKTGESYCVEWVITPVRAGSGEVAHWVALQREITRQKNEIDQLSAELQHRTRNLLSVVQAIAYKTLEVESEKANFGKRLSALSRVQGHLSRAGDGRVDFETILRGELAALPSGSNRITTDGPSVGLPRPLVEIVALALHELATNASAHGALACDTGQLAVTWTEIEENGGPWLRLVWREWGVRVPVDAGVKRGYGREVIENALVFSLRAKTRFDLGPDGLTCVIDLPLPPVLSHAA